MWTITDSSVPLPIELLEFTASMKQGFVELNWRTETESDNDFFEVQRTSDGEAFHIVAQLKGAGTSLIPMSYVARDHNPLVGKQYYRLKQTDFDGAHTYSKLIAVNVPESLTWKVFPNPSDGKSVSILFSQNDVGKDAVLIIYDVNGSEVFSSSPFRVEDRQATFSFVERIPAGMYLLSIGVERQVSRIKLLVR